MAVKTVLRNPATAHPILNPTAPKTTNLITLPLTALGALCSPCAPFVRHGSYLETSTYRRGS